MKDLNVNKSTMARLQDEDMANLVGAIGDIVVTNTSSGKASAEKQIAVLDRAEASSCCQKSCK